MRAVNYLLILITSYSFAQTKFEKGYIIGNTGEKTDCYIKNDDWDGNPSQFTYKFSLEGESKTGNLQNVVEFGVESSFKYIKANVDMDRASLDLNNFNEDRTPKLKPETVFLRVLREANESFYSYEENNLHLYFIKVSKNKIEQLINKPYKMEDSKIGFYQYYKQQLINSFDCGDLKSIIEKTAYNKSDLTAAFDKYYECSGQVVKKASQNSDKTEFNIRLRPGISYRSTKLHRSGETADVDYGSKPCFRIGLEVEAALPFNNNKWALFIEPNYEISSFSKTIPTYGNVTLKENIFSAPIGVRYYVSVNKNSKLFLNLAYNIMLFRNSDGVYETTDENFSVEKKHTVLLGVGYNYKKFSLEARFDLNDSTGATDFVYISAKSKAYGLILGYKFL